MRRASEDWVNVSVSESTQFLEDLLPAFYSALEEIDPVTARAIMAPSKVGRLVGRLANDSATEKDVDLASWLIYASLCDALSAVAPAGCWFGAHLDDSACFGFWLDEGFDEDELDAPSFFQGELCHAEVLG